LRTSCAPVWGGEAIPAAAAEGRGSGQLQGGCPGFFQGGITAGERVFRLAAVGNLLDGQVLWFGVAGAVGGFFGYNFGGFFETEGLNFSRPY
jgi:hypothetical protein